MLAGPTASFLPQSQLHAAARAPACPPPPCGRVPLSPPVTVLPPNLTLAEAFFYTTNVAIFRHLLCDSGFAQCTSNVPEYDPQNPDFALDKNNNPATFMGEYFPRGTVCCRSTFESAGTASQGAAACFAAVPTARCTAV